MPRLEGDEIKVYNPATGTRQKIEAFSMPPLLPEAGEILEAAGGSPSLQQATQVAWAVRSASTWQVGAQLTLGSLVHSVGIPVMHLFDDVMQAVGVNAEKLFKDAIRQTGKTLVETIRNLGEQGEAAASGAVQNGLSQGVGIAVNNVSVIPVIGWVVQILFGLGKAIANIVRIHQADQRGDLEAIYKPSKFTAEGDTIVFEQLFLERVRMYQDWTKIYLPPTLGKAQSWQEPFYNELLEPCVNVAAMSEKERRQFEKQHVKNRPWQGCEGIRIIGGNPIEGALGNVPGAGFLHQSIEYFKGATMVDPGGFLPTARSQAGWLWQSAIRSGLPSAFTIDTELAQAAWESYLYDLREVIALDSKLNDEDRRRILRFWNGGNDNQGRWRPIFGWYPGGGALPASVHPANNEWDNYAPVKEVKALRKTQRQLLDTIVVAYLDNSFPSVNNAKSPEFHDLWERRRRQLLEHPDRCRVDLTNVPDPDYRDALKSSGVGKGICAQLGGGFQSMPEPKPVRTTPGLGDSMPGGGDDGTDKPGTKRTSSGSGGIVLAGAAVAGVALAAHKGYFQKIF